MKNPLTEEQIRAINLTRVVGERLASTNPEIAELYRNGSVAAELASIYVPEHFAISEHIACCMVHNALEILLGDEKREIAKEHITTSSGIKGVICRKNKTGIFSQTPEEFKQASRQGVVAAGMILYDDLRDTEYGVISERDYIIRLRVEGFSYEEITELVNSKYGHSRNIDRIRRYIGKLRRKGTAVPRISKQERAKAATLATIAAGNNLYDAEKRNTEYGELNELEYIVRLRSQGMIWREITDKVNSVFSNNRKAPSLEAAYSRRIKR